MSRVKLFLILLVLLCWLISFDLNSELSNIDPGFYSYGARATALGSAYTTLVYSPLASIWNPAGLIWMPGNHDFMFDHTDLLGIVSYNFAGYSHRFDPGLVSALGASYSGDDAFSEITFYFTTAVSMEKLLSICTQPSSIFKRLNLGLSLKYIGCFYGENSSGSYIDDNELDHQISGDAMGYGLNLGLVYQINDHNRIGLNCRNLINDIWWHSRNEVGTAKGKYRESLPLELTFGYSFCIDRFILSCDYNTLLSSETDDKICLGGEFNFFEQLFSLRMGYSQEAFSANNKQFSFGTGIEYRITRNYKLRLDISYRIISVWEGHNYLGLSCGFNN